MNSFRFRSSAFLIFLFSVSIGFVSVASAADSGSRFDFRQKATAKQGSRWTLQEWLAQKERNHMMDLWLGMYAPSPYEFYVKGSLQNYNLTVDPSAGGTDQKSYQSYSGGLGAYATIVGLEGDYENNAEEKYNDLSGSFNLRVLGNAVQGTHLILKYGLRTRDGEVSGQKFRVGNQFAGADLNLYLTKFFGLKGLYNHYFKTNDSNLGDISGSRSEAGIFIDFEMVRVFGQWFNDIQKNELNNVPTEIKRTGTQIGLQFFF